MLAPTMTTDSDASHESDARSEAPPSAPPAAPPRHDDEISLRELYLILKRGLPTILAVTLVAVVIAVVVTAIRPSSYEAEATVVSSPTVVQAEGEGTLAFTPRSAIAFATYEDIALNRGTFEATIDLLRADGVDAPASFQELRAAAEAQRLAGPANASDSTPLTVIHRIVWNDPALAAGYADAWAQATVEQVRTTLLADLEPARQQTVEAIAAREAALEEAEEAYQAFAENDLEGLEQTLNSANWRLTNVQNETDALSRGVAGLIAQRDALAAQAGVDAATLDAATLDLLEGTDRLSSDTAARIRLLATPAAVGGDASTADAAVALLARTDLQAVTVELAGLLHEREQLRSLAASTRDEIASLRETVAQLRGEEARIARRLENARAAYGALQAIEPALAFVAELTPGNTRVLSTAQEPVAPTGTSLAAVALVAAVVAALAATLFVFLREAVREPAYASRRTTPLDAADDTRSTSRGA